MSGSRIDDILREIAQLPRSEQNRFRHLLDQQEDRAGSRDRAVSLVPVPDSTRELRWVVDRAREYAGQWVALDGDRLIAHGPVVWFLVILPQTPFKIVENKNIRSEHVEETQRLFSTANRYLREGTAV